MARCSHATASRPQGVLLIAAWMAWCSACTSNHAEARCTLGQAHDLAQADALSFDAIAVAKIAGGALSAWSEPGGLFVRRLDANGAPSATSVRVGERCRGGLALVAFERGARIACGRPSDDEGASELLLITVDARGTARTELLIGRPGRDGRGVALRQLGGESLIAWHDGHVGRYIVRLTRVRSGEPIDTMALSNPTDPAFSPSLEVVQGKWLAAWSETHLHSLSESQTRIFARWQGRRARAVHDANVRDPSPQLATDGTNVVLGFRELPARESKADLFVSHLSPSLQLTGQPSRIGRANIEGAPSLVFCPSLRLSLLPREYAGERYVGIHALDRSLANIGAGHQYYENDKEIVDAHAACVGSGALVVTAEQAPVHQAGVRARAMAFACQ